MTNIKDALLDCSSITSDIMQIIADRLSDNNISFTHNNESEIIINDEDISDILNIILNIDELKDGRGKLLLQVTASNGMVFIRQKFS